MEFNDYKHYIPIQIRFSDIDRLNHVNNACYLNYFELGRVKYFNDVFKDNINWNEKGFVLARTEIDHIEPLFLNDETYCFSKVIKTGTKSLTIKNSVVKKVNTQMIECATGIGILVAMDYVKQESIELPGKWVELINTFEK
ncbi:MAG: fadM 1 [Bacteroidetes bacterium]|jgi:acyl-CoA thioester hydrolase|nr:fadM 1 [Bacteroidota bacterium]